MEKNIELLRKTLEHIKEFPEKHDQGNWIYFSDEVFPTPMSACNTSMCTAGHAAALAGADVPTYGQMIETGWILDKDGKLTEEYGEHVSDWAGKKLGMNEFEKDFIFLCMNQDAVFGRIEELITLWESGEELTFYSDDQDYEDYQE